MAKLSIFRKYDTLSDLSKDIGLVFFATLFIGPIATRTFDPVMIGSGLLLSIVSWIVSLSIARK